MIDSNIPDSLVLLYLTASFAFVHIHLEAAAENKWLLIIYMFALQRHSQDRKPEARFQESMVTSTASLLIGLGFADIRRWRIPAVESSRWKRGVGVSQAQRAEIALMPLWRGEDCSVSSTFKVKKDCAPSGRRRCDLSKARISAWLTRQPSARSEVTTWHSVISCRQTWWWV